jgi:hypothetical protein
MGVPLGNRRVLVPRRTSERYVAGADTRGRREGRPYPWSQQVIHEIPGLERGLGMNRSHTITIVPLIVLLVLGLFAANLACAQWKIQKTPPAVLDTDLADSPSRGPADAPVVIGVFSDFQ